MSLDTLKAIGKPNLKRQTSFKKQSSKIHARCAGAVSVEEMIQEGKRFNYIKNY